MYMDRGEPWLFVGTPQDTNGLGAERLWVLGVSSDEPGAWKCSRPPRNGSFFFSKWGPGRRLQTDETYTLMMPFWSLFVRLFGARNAMDKVPFWLGKQRRVFLEWCPEKAGWTRLVTTPWESATSLTGFIPQSWTSEGDSICEVSFSPDKLSFDRARLLDVSTGQTEFFDCKLGFVERIGPELVLGVVPGRLVQVVNGEAKTVLDREGRFLQSMRVFGEFVAVLWRLDDTNLDHYEVHVHACVSNPPSSIDPEPVWSVGPLPQSSALIFLGPPWGRCGGDPHALWAWAGKGLRIFKVATGEVIEGISLEEILGLPGSNTLLQQDDLPEEGRAQYVVSSVWLAEKGWEALLCPAYLPTTGLWRLELHSSRIVPLLISSDETPE